MFATLSFWCGGVCGQESVCSNVHVVLIQHEWLQYFLFFSFLLTVLFIFLFNEKKRQTSTSQAIKRTLLNKNIKNGSGKLTAVKGEMEEEEKL